MLLVNKNSIFNEQNTILMKDFIKLYESEMKKLDYSIASISRCSRISKSPYQCDTHPWVNRPYSSETSSRWLNKQRERLQNGDLSLDQFLVIENAIDACEELYHKGKLEKRAKHRVYEKYIPIKYKNIYNEFMDTFDNVLAPRTIQKHDTNCRHFFKYLEGCTISELRQLKPHDVESFLKQIYPEHKGSMSSMIRTVTLLLSFLKERDYIEFSLDCRMLKPASRRSPVLPCFTHEEVYKILSVIDTSTSIGKRNYAVILLASRTGLRASDIFNLKLYDIDWMNSEIHIVQSKTGNGLNLPLQVDAGNALVDYILHGRPETEEEYIFLRNVAPFLKLEGHCSSNIILKKYLNKVTFKWKSCSGKTFHALRRSIGTWMSEEGIPLSTIAEVLGHKNMNSTKSYLSYNKNSMTKCCLGLDGIPVLKEGLL